MKSYLPRRFAFVRDDGGYWYWSCPRRSLPDALPRVDGIGDVSWEWERSLSLCVLSFNIWSFKLFEWFFFLLFDFAVCQPPSYWYQKIT